MAPDWFLHDLRNRLTVALGFVQLLQKGKAQNDPELQERYLGFVTEALEDAGRLLNEKEKGEERRTRG